MDFQKPNIPPVTEVIEWFSNTTGPKRWHVIDGGGRWLKLQGRGVMGGIVGKKRHDHCVAHMHSRVFVSTDKLCFSPPGKLKCCVYNYDQDGCLAFKTLRYYNPSKSDTFGANFHFPPSLFYPAPNRLSSVCITSRPPCPAPGGPPRVGFPPQGLSERCGCLELNPDPPKRSLLFKDPHHKKIRPWFKEPLRAVCFCSSS